MQDENGSDSGYPVPGTPALFLHPYCRTALLPDCLTALLPYCRIADCPEGLYPLSLEHYLPIRGVARWSWPKYG
jgi:hypothetical protein